MFYGWIGGVTSASLDVASADSIYVNEMTLFLLRPNKNAFIYA